MCSSASPITSSLSATEVDSGLVVLGTFQTAARFTTARRRRYESLAEQCAMVAAFGVGMGPEPARGVRGADLRATDALAGEWVVIVLGAHFAGALIARDMGDDGTDGDRRFEFVITHDRHLVLAAARSLMRRLVPVAAGECPAAP